MLVATRVKETMVLIDASICWLCGINYRIQIQRDTSCPLALKSREQVFETIFNMIQWDLILKRYSWVSVIIICIPIKTIQSLFIETSCWSPVWCFYGNLLCYHCDSDIIHLGQHLNCSFICLKINSLTCKIKLSILHTVSHTFLTVLAQRSYC